MRFYVIACTALYFCLAVSSCNAFIALRPTPCRTSCASLNAIGVLARKAKEMDVQKYINSGEVKQEILDKLKLIEDASSDTVSKIGQLQSALTKRKGTISIIAEYKRRLDKGAFIDEIYDPEILSPTFREFGATAIAVMADERMGGCSYDDISKIKKEQDIAKGDVPGPLFLISSDFIVHKIQIAQSAAAGACAVVIQLGTVGKEKAGSLIKAAHTVGMEVIAAISNAEEAQSAVDIGASILMVGIGVGEEERPEAKISLFDSLDVPEGLSICKVANIHARDDKGLQEVEDAWICRDKGFQAVWACDFLYKSGNDVVEHPGAIINSMKSKSSVKWASPKARSGKGEGAREYLGDIMM